MKNGDIIFWGETVDNSVLPLLHIHNAKENKLNYLPALCQHTQNIDVQAITIQNTEYIAVSCAHCNAIRLTSRSSNDHKVSMAFQDKSYWPGQMCEGSEGTLFVVNLTKEISILVLDSSTTDFHVKDVVKTDTKAVYDICYVPFQDILLIGNWNPGMIRAVSMKTHQTLWEVTSAQVEGLRTHGMLYIPQKNFVLVADGARNRILALQATSGEIVELLQEKGSGAFLDFFLSNDIVVALKVIRDEIGEALVLSHFTVRIIIT